MVFFDACGEERKEEAASGEINDEQFEFRQILQSFSRREDFKTVSQAKNNLNEYVRDILKELLQEKPTALTQFICVSGAEKNRNSTLRILREMI